MLHARHWNYLHLALALICPVVLCAQTRQQSDEENELAVPKGQGRGFNMDYGPCLAYTINCKPAASKSSDNLALKGLAIKLGPTNQAAVCFDTELMRYAAGWT